MKIGIYCRVSTEEQKAKGISILDQEERGKKFCLKRQFEYEVFNDAGLSGELSPDERPELNRLLDKIYLKEIQGIFVVDFDRITRDDRYGFVLKKLLIDNDVKLFDTHGEINLNDETQDLLLGIKILLSSFELKKLKVRIKRSLERSVAEGRVGGGPLITYGYKKGEDKKLIIDEVESNVVKLIFQLAIQGKGTKVIANYLNDENIPTKRNTSKVGYLVVKGEVKTTFKWRDSVVYRILTNKMYYGVRIYKGNEYPSPKIIEKDKYDLVQQLLKKRNNMKDTTNKYFYLLKGLIECAECKSRFYGLKRADLSSNYYGCSSQRHIKEWCKTKGINIDYLDNLILNQISNLDKDVDRFFDWYKQNNLESHYLSDLVKARNNEKITKDKIDKLLELGLDGKIAKDVFNSKMEELNIKLEQAKVKKLHLLKQYTISNKREEVLNLVKLCISNITQTEDLKLKREYVRSIVDKVYVQWVDNLQQHHIYIKYKIDNLTQYSLEKDIELNYSKAGYRIKRNEIFTEKIIVKKYFANNGNVLEAPLVEIF
ncbi:putative DNA recombinase [Flavobacterium collinsii]|uniref:recombinase family protein n=1 Tax=Flavobacterium collinsii TaxID=1114861 RepID=UPI0022C888CA|nr:recombinase family protein [Flavobacterium collinsii]GIQ57948.1 putative DNA recombinase [Flavobacterium collinsii]